jgi:hypothetical protein
MIGHIPPGAFLRSVILRTTLVWAFVRAVVSGAAAGLSASGVSAELGASAGLPVVLVVTIVVWGDQHRRGEVPFLRNLGVGPAGMLLPVVVLAAALELVLVLTVGV